jgi:hypothetical protein
MVGGGGYVKNFMTSFMDDPLVIKEMASFLVGLATVSPLERKNIIFILFSKESFFFFESIGIFN